MDITYDLTLNLPTILTVLTFIVAGVGAWVSLKITVTESAKSLEDLKKTELATLDRRFEQFNAGQKIIDARIEAVSAKSARDLSDFKVMVAERYATNEVLRDIKTDIMQAIRDVQERLNQLVQNRE